MHWKARKPRFTFASTDRPTVRRRSITLLGPVCLDNPSVTMQTSARLDGTGHDTVVRSGTAAKNVRLEFRALSTTYENEFITRKSAEKDQFVSLLRVVVECMRLSRDVSENTFPVEVIVPNCAVRDFF